MDALRSRLYIKLLEAEVRRLERVVESKDQALANCWDRNAELRTRLDELTPISEPSDEKNVDELVARLAAGMDSDGHPKDLDSNNI